MTCIYRRSKYYEQAQLNPLDIVEPIGYKYLNQEQKSKTVVRKKEGQVIIKYISDSSLTKQLSQRGTPFRELERVLKISESTQRKNFNLNGQNLQFVNRNLSKDTLNDLREAYFPSKNDRLQWLSFLELVGAMSVLREVLFSIRDYALSTYLVYYQGENLEFYNYIQQLINEEFIEYDNQILINCPQLSRPQLRKIDYGHKSNVEHYINEILQIGNQKDPLFGGVHLYICDTTPEIKDNESVIREEAELWSYLQFQITVITSILNDGQHAVLKIGGSFTPKTIEYIFLLKLAFNRVYLHKSILSNPFNNDKYIVCEGFNKDNGQMISRFLLDNYDVIQKEGENSLLVELKAIYANDFHTNVNDFNNLSPIIKISKEVLQDFNDNCNTVFYPSAENVVKKLQKWKLYDFEAEKTTFETLIPESSEKKNVQKEPQILQKEAEVIDFSEMMNMCQPSRASQAGANKGLLDLSSKKDDAKDEYMQKYLSNGDKMIKMKVEKAKKKKAKQKQDRL